MSSEFKVGLFTIIGAGVLTSTAFVLGGNPFETGTQHFYTIMDNIGGVAERTQVRSSGVQIGEVTRVEILQKGARIDFDIKGKLKIPKGSYVEVKARGILGDVYLEVMRTEKKLGYYSSGDFMPKNPETNDMDSLMANLNDIARDIKKVTKNFAKVLGSKEGEQSLQNIVSNIEGVTKDLREVSSTQRENLKEAIQLIRDSAIHISGLLKRNDTKIDQIIADVHTFTAQLRMLSTDGNREKVENIIANIDEATTSLKNIATKLEKGEGTIGQLIAKDDTADEIKETLKSIQDVIKPISQLKLSINDRLEGRVANAVNGDRFSNEFNIVLATRPDRYYLFGIKNSVYGRVVTDSVTTTTTSGNTTTVNTQTNTPENVGNWRYNIQIAQRFSFVGLRFGLFGSSAGVGADWYMFRDRLVTSFEFSQFGGGSTPTDHIYGSKGPFNLKAYANYYVTSNLFLSGGFDGLVLYSKPFPFFGAGFFISDDDLKGLLGVAAVAK